MSNEPWVTAAETSECAIAHAAAGDLETATQLLRWTRRHRDDDGSYWTGIVYPDREHFPAGERTAYTAAAVILAADTIAGASPASGLFLGEGLLQVPDDDWPGRARRSLTARPRRARPPTRAVDPARRWRQPAERRSTRSEPQASTSTKRPLASAGR